MLQLFSFTWIVLCAELSAQLGLSTGGRVVFGGSGGEVCCRSVQSLPVSGVCGVRVEQRLGGIEPAAGSVESCTHVRGAAGAGVLLAHLSAPPIRRVDEAAEHGSEVLGGD